jgi:uncharacterized glyoxalase superfamily protein PhnB
MKPTPPGWPRISTALYYADASAAIDWLCRAFGFEVRLKVEGEGGRIEHCELVFGEGLIMLGQIGRPLDPEQDKFPYRRAHCARARAAGARITMEPKTTDYGEEYSTDRGYECADLGGHHWWFYQRLRDPRPT